MILGPEDGKRIDWAGGFGVRFMLGGEQTDGRFAVVEHPLGPRALAAPMHTHEHEDEYSYVLEGEVGFQIGDEVVVARAGDFVLKPRGVPHAFWNAGDAPARVLELISPAGFERYFEDLAEVLPTAGGPPDERAFGELLARYGLQMELDSIPRLAQEHGLAVPGPA